MNTFLELLGIASGVVLTAAPAILIARLIAGSEPSDLAELVAARAELPWPRGVQEEDPQPWRFDAPEIARPAPDQESGVRTSRRARRTIPTNSRRCASGRMCDGAPA